MQPPKLILSNKGNSMSEVKGLMAFVSRRSEKKVDFMGGKLTITKLTLGEVEKIQEMGRAAAEELKKAQTEYNEKYKEVPVEERPEFVFESANGLSMLTNIIRIGAEGAADMTEDDFRALPLDDISKLAEEIMRYSGMKGEEGNLAKKN